MNTEKLTNDLRSLLRECDLVYRERYSGEEIALLADIFLDDLAMQLGKIATKMGKENPEAELAEMLAEAFRMHRLESRIFPRPWHIKTQLEEIALEKFRPQRKTPAQGEPAPKGTGKRYLEKWKARRANINNLEDERRADQARTEAAAGVARNFLKKMAAQAKASKGEILQ